MHKIAVNASLNPLWARYTIVSISVSRRPEFGAFQTQNFGAGSRADPSGDYPRRSNSFDLSTV